MAVNSDTSAPYAGTNSILSILDRYRNKGMQKPINSEVLARSGIPDSLVQRTLQALVILDLIDADGNPTEVIEGLRLASENDYKSKMQDWLKASYSDIFMYVDPAEDDEVSVRDAFRSYKPNGQQNRMVSLFIGLCEAAGMRPPKEKSSAAKSNSPPKPRASTPRTSSTKKNRKNIPETIQVNASLPTALNGLLHSLPPESQGWTQDRRDKFVETFSTVLDFCIPIVEQVEAGVDDSDDEQ